MPLKDMWASAVDNATKVPDIVSDAWHRAYDRCVVQRRERRGGDTPGVGLQLTSGCLHGILSTPPVDQEAKPDPNRIASSVVFPCRQPHFLSLQPINRSEKCVYSSAANGGLSTAPAAAPLALFHLALVAEVVHRQWGGQGGSGGGAGASSSSSASSSLRQAQQAGSGAVSRQQRRAAKQHNQHSSQGGQMQVHVDVFAGVGMAAVAALSQPVVQYPELDKLHVLNALQFAYKTASDRSQVDNTGGLAEAFGCIQAYVDRCGASCKHQARLNSCEVRAQAFESDLG